MRVAVAQITSSDQPVENLASVLALMDQSNDQDILFLPEVTNCVSLDRAHQAQVLDDVDNNLFLDAVCKKARALGLWVALGSIALKTHDVDGRYTNRSILIDACGAVVAQYDKIHMFDATMSDTERYHESKGYRPGDTAVLARTPWGSMGLSICYDLRFPALYRILAQAGAVMLVVPSAFSRPTGEAHWHTLLRARAIENGCFVLASAQTGEHPGSGRKTYGHSLIVDPWGQVIMDAGQKPGLYFTELDLKAVTRARMRIASLRHDRPFEVRHYPSND